MSTRPRIVWAAPRSDSAIDLAALYPALYLTRGFDVALSVDITRAGLDGAQGLVLPLWRGDEDAAGAAALVAAGSDVPVILLPWTAAPGAAGRIARASDVRILTADPLGVPGEPERQAGRWLVGTPPLMATEDRLLRHRLGRPAPAPGLLPDVPTLCLVVLGPAVPKLPSSLIADHVQKYGWMVTVVSPHSAAADLPIRIGRRIPLDSPDVGPAIAGACGLVLLCDEADLHTVEPALLARTALVQGVPVLANAHRSLWPLASAIVIDDWARGLALLAAGHLPSSLYRKAGGLHQHRVSSPPERLREAWETILAGLPRAARAPLPPRTHRLTVLFDFAQDLDILLPILEAARLKGGFAFRVLVSQWLREASVRTIETLDRLGYAFEYVARGKIRAGQGVDLTGTDAVLAAAETSVADHGAGHSLAKAAAAAGIPAFTLQHGLENIGINYADSEHGTEIRFASSHMFIWANPGRLPPWLAPESRAKMIPVGMPGGLPGHVDLPPIPGAEGRKIVGIFENLHWHRYDAAYRAGFVQGVGALARARPDTLLLVKPHHAGRWSVKRRAFDGAPDNVVVLDPDDPVWQPFTAPALMVRVDAVITTPSTVAVDGVRAGKPVAVVGGGLDLPLYAPLPVLRTGQDWFDFLDLAEGGPDYLELNEIFLAQNILPGRADARIVDYIEEVLADEA